MDKNLVIIGRAARKEIMNFARRHPNIGNPVDLTCFCAIASYFFKLVAEPFGYDLTLVEGIAFDSSYKGKPIQRRDINHCWTEYDGMVYDLTATQFKSGNAVHVVKNTNKNYISVNPGIKTDDRNLSESFPDWIDEQTPIMFKRELKRRAENVVYNLQVSRAIA